MKTRMTRLGRRSPGRILAVPRPDTGDWPPAGASQWRPDGKGPQMADTIEVILPDDQRIRRLLRDAMSLAASGPRSFPPRTRDATAETRIRGRLAGRAGQARPVTAPFTKHSADLAAFSWEGERGWTDNCCRRRSSS